MDVVSYRGPGVAGGVSSGLGTAWRRQSQSKSKWWFLNKGILEVLAADDEQSKFVSLLPESLVQGHYAYCNAFLWPIMHDLPQHASYSNEEHEHYRTFNRLIAEQIDVESAGRQEYFIQDYQLGLTPKWLALFGHKAVVFWHIPWPKHIPDHYVKQIAELALGLLGATALGFHTDEYARNFMRFVSNHLPGFRVDQASMTIEKSDETLLHGTRPLAHAAHNSYVLQPHIPARARSLPATKLIVHPLGIDFEFWSELRESSQSIVDPELAAIANSSFILSVDRVDYTKSVLERLLIIDKFFQEQPQWRGVLSFVQVCGRSRPGLPAFDHYWHSCHALAAALNHKWSTENWQPLCWIEHSLCSKELAYLYSHAQAMLVNPVRDGLNLTAKEFVACQSDQPGTLLLSPGAGAINELGDYALHASPRDHERTVDSLAQALTMPLKERQLRTVKMKTILVSNQLAHWWSTFSRATRMSDIHLLDREIEIKKRSLG